MEYRPLPPHAEEAKSVSFQELCLLRGYKSPPRQLRSYPCATYPGSLELRGSARRCGLLRRRTMLEYSAPGLSHRWRRGVYLAFIVVKPALWNNLNDRKHFSDLIFPGESERLFQRAEIPSAPQEPYHRRQTPFSSATSRSSRLLTIVTPNVDPLPAWLYALLEAAVMSRFPYPARSSALSGAPQLQQAF